MQVIAKVRVRMPDTDGRVRATYAGRQSGRGRLCEILNLVRRHRRADLARHRKVRAMGCGPHQVYLVLRPASHSGVWKGCTLRPPVSGCQPLSVLSVGPVACSSSGAWYSSFVAWTRGTSNA